MKKSVVIIGLLIILAGALISSLLVASEPVARVNGYDISASEYEQQLSIFGHYAQVISAASGSEQNVSSPAFTAELRRLTLDSLIDKELVSRELEARVGKQEADSRISAKLAAATSTATLGDTVEKLYGVSIREFEQAMLVPVAAGEILTEELLAKSEDFESWMAAARASAVVTVYVSDLAWSGSEVIKKE